MLKSRTFVHRRRHLCVAIALCLALFLSLLPTVGFAAGHQPAGPAGHMGQVCRTVYVVHRGDTLSGIAARFGVTVSALTRTNRIPNPNRIYRGERLCIPWGPPPRPMPMPTYRPHPPVHPSQPMYHPPYRSPMQYPPCHAQPCHPQMSYPHPYRR